jgi:hypothetical protein
VRPVMSLAKFEPFFRVAAGLDIDKSDLKRSENLPSSPAWPGDGEGERP